MPLVLPILPLQLVVSQNALPIPPRRALNDRIASTPAASTPGNRDSILLVPGSCTWRGSAVMEPSELLQGVRVDVLDFSLGLLLPILVARTTTAAEAIHKYVNEHRCHLDAGMSWALYKIFVTPPIERALQPDELVMTVQSHWPATDGALFCLRAISSDLAVTPVYWQA